MDYKIIRLTEAPELKKTLAEWFSAKWSIPIQAYTDSMNKCLSEKNAVPQWYIAMESNRIIGGVGVIENDFHERRDLSPNVCALYVEPDRRCKGMAGALLDFAVRDMAAKSIYTLYLLTDHVSFYERYGWEFLCEVQGDGESEPSRMYVHRYTLP